MTKDEKDLFEKKMIRSYVNTMTGNNNITSRGEKIVNSYRNASYEPVSKMCDLSIKLMDDSMAPIYLKGDRVFFRKKMVIIVVMILLLLLRVMFYLLEDYIKVVRLLFFRL